MKRGNGGKEKRLRFNFNFNQFLWRRWRREEKKNPVYSVQNTFEEGNERRRPRHALYREIERKKHGKREDQEGRKRKRKRRKKIN